MARVSDWLLLFLVNAAWQVAFVGSLAAVIDRLLRAGSARYRHLLWVAALIAAVMLPLVTTLRFPPATAKRTLESPMTSSAPAIPVAPNGSIPVAYRQPAPSWHFEIPTVALSAPAAATICALYGLLLLFRIGGLTAAWRRTLNILRQASEVELPPAIAAALARCRNALRTGNVRVLSSSVPVPFTLGTLRPAVVLPESLLQQANADVVTSAVGHELAHIARHDYLFNVAYELLALPLWFHPALALVLRRIRETREVRCDEIVTERLQDARVYAQSLVELAGAALPFGRAAATITVGIADADILEERVKTLLNRPRLKQQTILLAAAALLFAVPCVAAARLALRVHIQPATAAALPAAQQSQPDARQDFINQHQPGDMVRGKVVKTTDKRAIVELAPGVNSVIRIPASSSTPYVVGSEHDFQLLRTDPEQKGFALFDPSSAVPGGPTGGVEGGVRTGVVGGIEGGKEGPFMIRADAMTNVHPKIAFDYAGQEPSGPVVRKKLDMAERKQAEEALLGEKQEEPRTPEQQAKLLALLKQRRAAESKELLQTAREAKITMEQAISIAQTQQAGTVFESRLARERGVATYIVGIVSGDETNTTRTRFLIDAADGKVMGTFREQPNE